MTYTHVAMIVAMAVQTMSALAQPEDFVDLGRRDQAETIVVPIHLDFAEDVFWVRVSLPAVGEQEGLVDIWTRFESLSATVLEWPRAAIFDRNGLIVYRFLGGGSWNQVHGSMGQTSPRRPQNIVNGDRGDDEGWCHFTFDGRWGPLADGDYWIAIGNGIVGFSDGWRGSPVVNQNNQAERETTLYIRVHPPEIPFCDPDLNWDGNADQDDVAYLIDLITNPSPIDPTNACGADPDYNRDGIADMDDVRALIDVIASGECPE
ncbi:MAG: hypothetical protein WAZ94_05635 [Phycisphaerales bacterium]